jgi:hypothetical protein
VRPELSRVDQVVLDGTTQREDGFLLVVQDGKDAPDPELRLFLLAAERLSQRKNGAVVFATIEREVVRERDAVESQRDEVLIGLINELQCRLSGVQRGVKLRFPFICGERDVRGGLAVRGFHDAFESLKILVREAPRLLIRHERAVQVPCDAHGVPQVDEQPLSIPLRDSRQPLRLQAFEKLHRLGRFSRPGVEHDSEGLIRLIERCILVERFP